MSYDYQVSRFTHVYVIMEGNPFEGFQFYGTFPDVDSASEWAEKDCDWEWWLINLVNPDFKSDQGPHILSEYEKQKVITEKGWK
jgi:hypothetical protein